VRLIPNGGLIVSCQARVDNPLHGPIHMAAMARAAEEAGAVAIRANGPDDIRAIRAATQLPVIGLYKVFSDAPVYITPSGQAAAAIMEAGARIVALDCTERPRGETESWQDIVVMIKKAGCEVFADISNLDEGLKAADMGADYVATTLSGYTAPGIPTPDDPDLELVGALATATDVPVVAEGRIACPAQAAEALDRGAHAVVVGTMITNPRSIARTFVQGLRMAGRRAS